MRTGTEIVGVAGLENLVRASEQFELPEGWRHVKTSPPSQDEFEELRGFVRISFKAEYQQTGRVIQKALRFAAGGEPDGSWSFHDACCLFRLRFNEALVHCQITAEAN